MQTMRRRTAKCSSTAADIRIRQIAVVRTITTVISVICSILIVRGMISSIATIGCENNAINRHWFHPKWTTSIQKGPEGLKGATVGGLEMRPPEGCRMLPAPVGRGGLFYGRP
jgi:hypothetical protein